MSTLISGRQTYQHHVTGKGRSVARAYRPAPDLTRQYRPSQAIFGRLDIRRLSSGGGCEFGDGMVTVALFITIHQHTHVSMTTGPLLRVVMCHSAFSLCILRVIINYWLILSEHRFLFLYRLQDCFGLYSKFEPGQLLDSLLMDFATKSIRVNKGALALVSLALFLYKWLRLLSFSAKVTHVTA